MPTEHSSSGDPARTLQLLWREPGDADSRRGPRQSLSVDRVVTAAIALADSDGLASVTMRAVARALGVVPMSVYTYVPGKAELLDLMLDTVYLQMPRGDLSGMPWRERLAAVAQENHDLFTLHPWIAEVSTSRPPLGPGLMAKYEHELQALEGLGLDDVERDAALTFLLGFVQAAARSAADAAAARQDSAMSEEQWWAANAPCSPGSSTRRSTPQPPASAPPQAPPTAPPMIPTTPMPSACSASSTASASSSTPAAPNRQPPPPRLQARRALGII